MTILEAVLVDTRDLVEYFHGEASFIGKAGKNHLLQIPRNLHGHLLEFFFLLFVTFLLTV